MFVYGNGNVVNTNGSYGTISDSKLKENIVAITPNNFCSGYSIRLYSTILTLFNLSSFLLGLHEQIISTTAGIKYFIVNIIY